MKHPFILTLTVLIVAATLMALPAAADPFVPVYSTTFGDAVTGDAPNPISSGGNQYWSIDLGADSYQDDYYERPTTQTFINVGSGVVGAAEYYGNLDIVQAKAGFDSQYLYVAIDMFSLLHQLSNGESINEGLIYRYAFRLSDSDADGANGFLFTVDQPSLLGTSYQLLKNEGFQDTNGDVGGAGGISVTKDDGDVVVDGFDLKIIGDGRLLSGPNTGVAVLYSRIDPSDPTIVEFAIDYQLLGIDPANLLYLDMEAIKGGPKDPQNYLWNDKYTFSEAGTPYTTAGTQNIYELDTLRGGGITVPEPSTLLLLGSGLAMAIGFGKKRLFRKSS